MAAETDPDRMGGRHVIEPTAIFRAGPDPESGEDVGEPVDGRARIGRLPGAPRTAHARHHDDAAAADLRHSPSR